MRFKHAFHVLIDNFSTTYKLLLYRLVIALITAGLCSAIIIPTLKNILSYSQFQNLVEAFKNFWTDLSKFELTDLQAKFRELLESFSQFKLLLADKIGLAVLAGALLILVHLINRFFVNVGAYVSGAMINDRMCLHASSSFVRTMVKNLGKACLYALIYAPLSFLFDTVGIAVIFGILTALNHVKKILILKVFLVAVLVIVFYAVKFTFTCDWLPCLIHSKKSNRQAMTYSFNPKGRRLSGVMSTAVVLMVIIIALNVAACLFTFGAGLLLTIPATRMILTCYQFVNYFDNKKHKYFVDEYTVIGPQKEAPPTREEFFKGDD